MDPAAKAELIGLLSKWNDQDEPMVEALGNTLAEWVGVDSQEMGRRLLSTFIAVLDAEL